MSDASSSDARKESGVSKTHVSQRRLFSRMFSCVRAIVECIYAFVFASVSGKRQGSVRGCQGASGGVHSANCIVRFPVPVLNRKERLCSVGFCVPVWFSENPAVFG